MPKALSQKAVKELCEEWSALQVSITKAEEAKQRAMAPLVEKHNEELKPVLAKHDPKIEGLITRSDEVRTQIREWMLLQPKDMNFSGETWIAGVLSGESLGNRVVDVKKFLDLAKQKGDAIYECVTVILKKAEPLIGKKKIDEISSQHKTPTRTFTLQRKD
jgi:hypothetical protein